MTKIELETRARDLLDALDRMYDGPALSHNVQSARFRLRDLLPRVGDANDRGKAKEEAA